MTHSCAPIRIQRPPLPLEEVRATGEGRMARELNPSFASSDWGQRMIRQAGDEAVKRELERRRSR